MAHAPIGYAEPTRDLLGGQPLFGQAEHMPTGFARTRTGSLCDIEAISRKRAAEQLEHIPWQNGKRTVFRRRLRNDDLQPSASGSEFPGNVVSEDVGHLFQVTCELAHCSCPIMFAKIIKWNRIPPG